MRETHIAKNAMEWPDNTIVLPGWAYEAGKDTGIGHTTETTETVDIHVVGLRPMNNQFNHRLLVGFYTENM